MSPPVHLVHTHYPVPASPIFTYGTTSDHRSPSHDSSAESVTPKGNPTSYNKPPNPVRKVIADPDSDPSSLDSSLSDSSDSSDDEYYKIRRRAKRIRINVGVKRVLMTLSKSAQSLQLCHLQLRKNQRS